MLKLPTSENAPGMLRANITTQVFEPGGDASIQTLSVPYSPFPSYVGINLNQPQGRYIETDKEHIFDIVTVNSDGKPVNRSGLEYKIYRISWSWWWENDNESFETYINSSSITPVATGRLNTTGGKGQFSFKVNYPDWGRYLVTSKTVKADMLQEVPSTWTGLTGEGVLIRVTRVASKCYLFPLTKTLTNREKP